MGDLTDSSMEWLDRYWDPAAGLLWNMDGAYDEVGPPRSFHLVAHSAWHVAGLLIRGARGDEERAAQTIEALLACQYDEPGTAWHGTFARFLEAPKPVAGAVVWVDYDPNWRQFVGTVFELLLQPGQPGEGLSQDLRSRMHGAVAAAVESEPPDRVPPSYSNIALMKAWLEVEHERPGAEAYAAEVVQAFDDHGAFAEYNSPTYYGVDLYALALWRDRSSSPTLREWGRRLEEALWGDIARWYHPGLGNLCGPFSRSYGMDMRRYLSLLGVWMWPVVGPADAPVPPFEGAIDHGHDLAMAPLVEHLGASVPSEVVGALVEFTGEREVRQPITSSPRRTATGWLSETVMAGGEHGELGVSARGQYHPATVHWRLPEGGVGWLRLVHQGPARAVAGKGRLAIECLPHKRRGPQPPELVIHAGSSPAPEGRAWSLPGLDVSVSADPVSTSAGDGNVHRVRFAVGTEILDLTLHPTG